MLANLFMHYAFDLFLAREFPDVQFERYADDAVVHCVTERQAERVRDALGERLASLGLRLHPDKTRIVYCQDDKRRGAHEHTSFTFLGFTFTRRSVLGRSGTMFNGFLPAVSATALKEMSRRVRRWRIHRHNGQDLAELAAWVNPIVSGWMTYYGRFYRSRLYPLLRRVNTYLMRWARQKYRRLRTFKAVHRWWRGLLDREPTLFRHWAWMRDVEITQG